MEKRIICLAVSLMIFVFSPAHAFTLGALEFDIDRVGCDFKNFVVPNADRTICINACGLDSRCQACNFDSRSGTPVCFLKNCAPVPRSSVGVVGGVKFPSTMSAVESNVDRTGCDFTNFVVPSSNVSVCSNACGLDSRCEAWNFDSRSGIPICFLKNCAPEPISSVGVIGGVKFH
jgi:PAN domain-containing protein